MRILLLKMWRDMLAHKGQFLGLILLVALGVTAYVGFIGSYLNLKTSAEQVYAVLGFEDFSVKVLGAPENVVTRVRALPGVAAAEAKLVGDIGMDLPDGGQGNVRIIGAPTNRQPTMNRLLLESGRYLQDGDVDAGVVHKRFASEVGLTPGDYLTIRNDSVAHRIRIVGIVSSAEYVFPIRAKGELASIGDFTILWLPERTVQSILGRGAEVTDISVRVAREANVDKVIARAKDELEPYLIVSTVPRADQPSNFSLGEEIGQNEILASIMPPLILAIAVLSLSIALSRLVQSQRGEIGLAKALGYGDGDILVHYLLFSLVVAVAGSTLGVLFGQLLSGWMTGLYVDMLGVPMLETRWYPSVILTAALVSSACCLLAGLAPALRSARMPPARAMRPDPNAAMIGGHIPLGERTLSPVLPRKLVWRIPIRNVFRSRRRSAYTIVGIALAVLLSVGTMAFSDSIDYLLNVYFGRVEKWGVSAFFDRSFSGSVAEEVRHWDGVTNVQSVIAVPATVKSDSATHEGSITGIEPVADFHGFEIIGGGPFAASVRAGELILPEILADKLRVSAGDTVRVKTPYLHDWTVVTVGSISREAIGTPMFTGVERATELMNATTGSRNGMYVSVERGKAAQIKERLYDLPGATQVLVLSEVEQMLRGMMDFTYVMFSMLLGFGFAMAFVVIYNTFTANVLERTREIATMRTIGEDSGHLAVMVTAENLLLAIVGIPIGVWAGLMVAQRVLDAMSSEEFAMRIVVQPASIALVVGAIVVVMLVSEALPVRRVFNLDLAEATKIME